MIGGNSIFSDDVTCEVAAGVLEVGAKVCFVLGKSERRQERMSVKKWSQAITRSMVQYSHGITRTDEERVVVDKVKGGPGRELNRREKLKGREVKFS